MQTAKLLKKETVAEETMAFYFEKPKGFTFRAGQSVDITLTEPTEIDLAGNTRTYSIASAPHEPELMIATRLRDTAFKRQLRDLPLEKKVTVSPPMGSFTLHNDSGKPAVFLIGGIGITPVRSIVLDAVENKKPHAIFVFYSNRRPEDAAFLEELLQLSKQNRNIQITATMTGMEDSGQPWRGETSYIDFEMIKKRVPEPFSAIYYSAGPLPMVTAMRTLLNASGVNDDDIRTEEFAGY